MKKILLLIAFIIAIIFSQLFGNNNKVLAEENGTSKIRVIYFYSPDCPKCQKIKPFIEEIKEEYKDKIEFLEHDVREKEECRQLFYRFIDAYNVPSEKAGTPLIFVGKEYLAGIKEIKDNLSQKINEKINNNENLIFDCHKFLEEWPNVKKIDFNGSEGKEVCGIGPKTNYCSIDDDKNTGTSGSINKKITLGIIIGAAAIDSINPCAIAVLIFLLAILLSAKYSRKKIIVTGMTYISAVFISYYLSGLGLMKFIALYNIADQVRTAAGIVVIFLGILMIREGIYKNGRKFLIIPPKTKSIFLSLLKKGTLPSVFLAGIVVSAVELPCTGAIYLSILSMLSQENMKAQGYLYLFVYNFVFVLPLIVILLIGAWGFDIKRIETMRAKNRMTVKILMGITVIALGLFLLSVY
jgi:cytochrome c biogenesis protein CcdA/glutaredoxin